MEQPSDERLMHRIRGGDHDALAALVVRHHHPLLGYLYRLTDGDRPLAEDLVQETFARLLQPANFLSDRPFKPWLYAIATNLVRDTFRSAEYRRASSCATSPACRDCRTTWLAGGRMKCWNW